MTATRLNPKYSRTSVGSLDWSTYEDCFITNGALAYWNGAYSGTNSNLQYCSKGAFGTIVTKGTGDYLPISGGTVNGNVTLNGGSFFTSGTGTGHAIKNTSVQLKNSNNGRSSDLYHYYSFQDTDGAFSGWAGNIVRTNGHVETEIGVRTRNTSGTNYTNVFWVEIDKSNVCKYGASNASNFRSNLGIAAASSDRRLKSNIEQIGDEAVDFVRELKPCHYDIHGEHQVGFIAQDVYEAEKWDSMMAFESREGMDGLDDWEKMPDGSPTWKLDYHQIIAPLVATVQNLLERVDELERTVSDLQGQINGKDMEE